MSDFLQHDDPIHQVTYELTYNVRPREEIDAEVMADMQAAMRLHLPVHLESVHWRAFRNGGNVNKAYCYGYRLTIGGRPLTLDS